MSSTLPEGLAALLGGGGQSSSPMDALQQSLGQGDSGYDGGESDGPDTPESAALLQQALTALNRARLQEKDPEDQSAISQCESAIHKILAGKQQRQDQMLQGKMTPRSMRG